MSDDLFSSPPQDAPGAPGGKASGAVLGKSLEELVVDLQAPDEKVRSQAALSLGSLGDQRAFDPLVAALSDEHWYVRWNAAEALGKLGNTQAVDPLLTLMKETKPVDSPSRNTRIAVIKALGKLKDERAVPPLFDALDSSDPDTYRAVVKALEDLGAGARIPVSAVVEKQTLWNYRFLDDAAIITAFVASILLCIFLVLPWLDVNATCKQTCQDTGLSVVQPGPQAPSAFTLASGGVQVSSGTVNWTDDSGTIGVDFTVSPTLTFTLPLLWLVLVAGVAMIGLSGWLFWVRRLPRKRRQFHWLLLTAAAIALALEIYITFFLASQNLGTVNLTSHVIYSSATPGDTQAALTAAPDIGFWLVAILTVVVGLIAYFRARVQRRRG